MSAEDGERRKPAHVCFAPHRLLRSDARADHGGPGGGEDVFFEVSITDPFFAAPAISNPQSEPHLSTETQLPTLGVPVDHSFLQNPDNLEKSEIYLPFVAQEMMSQGLIDIEVIPADSRWFGVTYYDDKTQAVETLKELTDKGDYPTPLWKS